VAIAFGNSIVRPTTTAPSDAVTRKLVHMDILSAVPPGAGSNFAWYLIDQLASGGQLCKAERIETLIRLCG
jgi:hypothetical protein